MDIVLNEWPWFLVNFGLFITPCFPEFEATTIVVSTMSLWVRLPYIPLPLWHPKVVEEIGNTLRKFKEMDSERIEKGLFPFFRLCVDIDLNKALPRHIQMKHEDFNSTRV